MARRRDQYHHGPIPVPPNDAYNFFFTRSDCCKFRIPPEYLSNERNFSQAYTKEESVAFIKHINDNYTIFTWFCFAPILGIPLLPIAIANWP